MNKLVIFKQMKLDLAKIRLQIRITIVTKTSYLQMTSGSSSNDSLEIYLKLKAIATVSPLINSYNS